MGNKSAKFKSLRDKCDTMSDIIFDIKLEIQNKTKRNELIGVLIATLKECRREVNELLNKNLNTATNINLREIKIALGTNDFTDLNLDDISVDDLKRKLNGAEQSLQDVCNAIDTVEEINSLTNKLKSFMEHFGSMFVMGVSMIGNVALKAIKPS